MMIMILKMIIVALSLIGLYYGVKFIAFLCWIPYFNKRAKEMHKMIEEMKKCRGDFNG